ncbi:hypothetical protein TRAPUB_1500, partial [Trametes pubescens]
MSTAEDEDAVRRRPRYQAVFVLGPSSSGKTTLCDALAQELQVQPPQYIKEVARSVMKTHDFTRDDTDTYEMQHAIMSAQLDAEEQATAALTTTKLNSGSVVVLSDRSAIDPIVYASTSTVPGAMDRRQRLLDDSRLQVVLEPVPEWIHDDGVRSLEDPWEYNEALFTTLKQLDIPYVVIGQEKKDILARVGFVMERLRLSGSA